MMLPNAAHAFIDIAKISGYCLNLSHPEGRHKARVFQSVLGMGEKDSQLLYNAILKAVAENEAHPTEADQFGARYIMDFELSVNGRSATVRTGWIIRTKEDFARLSTCYIL